MSEHSQSGKPQSTREERLAQQLRANLRRRKAQARAMQPNDANTDSRKDDGGLSKKQPES